MLLHITTVTSSKACCLTVTHHRHTLLDSSASQQKCRFVAWYVRITLSCSELLQPLVDILMVILLLICLKIIPKSVLFYRSSEWSREVQVFLLDPTKEEVIARQVLCLSQVKTSIRKSLDIYRKMHQDKHFDLRAPKPADTSLYKKPSPQWRTWSG